MLPLSANPRCKCTIIANRACQECGVWCMRASSLYLHSRGSFSDRNQAHTKATNHATESN